MFESEGRLFTESGDMLEIKSVGYASTFYQQPYSAELTIKAVTCRNGEGKALKRFPVISRVLFSGPATIVFWDDGVKTVSKCDAKDEFDAHKGIEECVIKRMFGNSYTGAVEAINAALANAEVQ